MADFAFKFIRLQRRPAAFGADLVAHLLVAGVKGVARRLIGGGDVARGMDTDGQRRFSSLGPGAVIQFDIGFEPARVAADDRQHHRQFVRYCADHRFRAAAHTDPCRQRLGFRTGVDCGIAQGGAQGAGPADLFLPQQSGKQIQLFLEQGFVILEFKAKQRKGFGERAPAKDQFGPAV